MKRFKNWVQPVFDEDGWAYANWIMRNDRRPYGWRCLNHENLKIGKNTDIGHGCFLQAKYGIELGENVELGPFVYICSWSTIDDKKGKVIIKDGAKIGAHSTVMPNVTIGKDVTVGAHSFVSKDLPDKVVAVGVPCKIKYTKLEV